MIGRELHRTNAAASGSTASAEGHLGSAGSDPARIFCSSAQEHTDVITPLCLAFCAGITAWEIAMYYCS